MVIGAQRAANVDTALEEERFAGDECDREQYADEANHCPDKEVRPDIENCRIVIVIHAGWAHKRISSQPGHDSPAVDTRALHGAPGHHKKSQLGVPLIHPHVHATKGVYPPMCRWSDRARSASTVGNPSMSVASHR